MRVFWLIAFLILGGFAVVPADPVDGPIAQTSGPLFARQVEKDTFLLINQYRKQNDFPPLAWNDEIAKAARAHSKDMATHEVDFGHDGFHGRISHLKDALPGIWGAAENVLYTGELDDVAKHAVQLWLHSPHHLENIRGNYNYSGLGVWQDKDGTLYFTQIFVDVKPPEQTEVNPPQSQSTVFGLFADPFTRPAR